MCRERSCNIESKTIYFNEFSHFHNHHQMFSHFHDSSIHCKEHLLYLILLDACEKIKLGVEIHSFNKLSCRQMF